MTEPWMRRRGARPRGRPLAVLENACGCRWDLDGHRLFDCGFHGEVPLAKPGDTLIDAPDWPGEATVVAVGLDWIVVRRGGIPALGVSDNAVEFYGRFLKGRRI